MSQGLRAWWPVAAWAAVIVVATSVPLPADLWAPPTLPLDKATHFVLYLVLGVTLGRALRLSGRDRPVPGGVALTAALAFAAIDEWSQGLVPGRHPSTADWAADAVGVALGMVVCLWVLRRAAVGSEGER